MLLLLVLLPLTTSDVFVIFALVSHDILALAFYEKRTVNTFVEIHSQKPFGRKHVPLCSVQIGRKWEWNRWVYFSVLIFISFILTCVLAPRSGVNFYTHWNTAATAAIAAWCWLKWKRKKKTNRYRMICYIRFQLRRKMQLTCILLPEFVARAAFLVGKKTKSFNAHLCHWSVWYNFVRYRLQKKSTSRWLSSILGSLFNASS